MTETEQLHILARGEDSRHQFKRDTTNADGLATELAALANSRGGNLPLGVADTGQATGQVTGQVRRLLSVLVAEHSRSGLQRYRLTTAGQACLHALPPKD